MKWSMFMYRLSLDGSHTKGTSVLQPTSTTPLAIPVSSDSTSTSAKLPVSGVSNALTAAVSAISSIASVITRCGGTRCLSDIPLPNSSGTENVPSASPSPRAASSHPTTAVGSPVTASYSGIVGPTTPNASEIDTKLKQYPACNLLSPAIPVGNPFSSPSIVIVSLSHPLSTHHSSGRRKRNIFLIRP